MKHSGPACPARPPPVPGDEAQAKSKSASAREPASGGGLCTALLEMEATILQPRPLHSHPWGPLSQAIPESTLREYSGINVSKHTIRKGKGDIFVRSMTCNNPLLISIFSSLNRRAKKAGGRAQLSFRRIQTMCWPGGSGEAKTEGEVFPLQRSQPAAPAGISLLLQSAWRRPWDCGPGSACAEAQCSWPGRPYHRDTLIGRKCIKRLKIKCALLPPATCYLFVEMSNQTLSSRLPLLVEGLLHTHTSLHGKRGQPETDREMSEFLVVSGLHTPHSCRSRWFQWLPLCEKHICLLWFYLSKLISTKISAFES